MNTVFVKKYGDGHQKRILRRIAHEKTESYREYGAGFFGGEAAKSRQFVPVQLFFHKLTSLRTKVRAWTALQAAAVGFILCVGCEPNPDAEKPDATTDANVPVSTTTVNVGTHIAGRNHPEDFVDVHDGDHIKIVWGFQGFNMAVFAVRVGDPNATDITVSIAFFVDNISIASLYYTDLKPKLVAAGQTWFFDLYMITPEVGPLVTSIGKLSAIAWTSAGVYIGGADTTVGFDPPDDILP